MKAELDAEHGGAPFLVFRGGDRRQVVRTLPGGRRWLTLGARTRLRLLVLPTTTRSRACTASSSTSAGTGSLADHGLSRNGTFLNGERLHGERALHDGDTIRRRRRPS